MKRLALLSASLLLFAAPASAAHPMPTATHHEIDTLIDTFVKAVVLRPSPRYIRSHPSSSAARSLAAAWALAGPDLRGGTTREAWDRGTGVTVEQFPAIGSDFRHAWDGNLVSHYKAELTVNLRSAGKNAEVVAMPTVLLRENGRWVVDTMYTAGIFRLTPGHRGSCAKTSCAVTGVNDFGPAPSGGALGLPPPGRADWLWGVLGGLGGLIVLTLGSLLFYTRIRDRRARQAYEANMARPR
jgi:hypothetical protein